MYLKDLLMENRSYRRFHEEKPIRPELLVELVDMARYCPSGANRQPLKFITVASEEENAEVFKTLYWAKHLPEWEGPEEGERPTGYIAILGETEISHTYWSEYGIAAQAMLLGAVELGLGGCMIASIDRVALSEQLRVPSQYEILLVLALGVPKETVVLEDARHPGDFAYWRDDEGTHHVPKRPLSEVLLRNVVDHSADMNESYSSR